MSDGRSLRSKRGSSDRRAAGGWPFLVRWVAAVALSMAVAGVIEYTIAADQLEERSLAEAANGYEADLDGLTDVLSVDLAPAARQEAIGDELDRIAQTYGTENVLLFTADGRLIDATGNNPDEDKTAGIRAVLSSGSRSWEEENDEGEAGDGSRYEFLLPVRTPEGQNFVVEVDQQATIIEGLTADLRLRKTVSLLVGLLIAAPLSYLLGGRSLHRRQNRAEHAADTDALTGLAGRRPFRPTLQAALAGPAADITLLALIDIDGFKGVNDRLGHSFGDRVLCALAGSFDALGASDTAFRLGGGTSSPWY